jgi:predicted nucleic acid-binding protein
MRYYADSCIWIDFFEERYTIDLFEKCLSNNEELLISDILIDELQSYIQTDNLQMIIHLFESKKLLCKVISTNQQRIEAKNIAIERNIPPGDVLHAIIARDNNAVLVTRDKHFKQLHDICNIELY